MYKYCKEYQVMEGEPHLGKQTECELVEDEGEGLEILLTYMVDNQECPETFNAEDEFNGEDIELQTSTYLTNDQIDMLNDMFMVTSEWDEDMLRFLIEYREGRR